MAEHSIHRRGVEIAPTGPEALATQPTTDPRGNLTNAVRGQSDRCPVLEASARASHSIERRCGPDGSLRHHSRAGGRRRCRLWRPAAVGCPPLLSLGAGRWALGMLETGRGEQRSGTFNRTPGVPRRSCIGERVGDHLSAGWVPGCMVHAARSRGDVPFHVKHNGSSGAGLDHQARDFPVREAMLTSALPARDVSRETSVRIHPVRNSIYPVRSRTAGQPDSRTAGQRDSRTVGHAGATADAHVPESWGIPREGMGQASIAAGGRRRAMDRPVRARGCRVTPLPWPWSNESPASAATLSHVQLMTRPEPMDRSSKGGQPPDCSDPDCSDCSHSDHSDLDRVSERTGSTPLPPSFPARCNELSVNDRSYARGRRCTWATVHVGVGTETSRARVEMRSPGLAFHVKRDRRHHSVPSTAWRCASRMLTTVPLGG